MARDPADKSTSDLPGITLTPEERAEVYSALALAVSSRTRARQKEVPGSDLHSYYSRAIDKLNVLKEKFA